MCNCIYYLKHNFILWPVFYAGYYFADKLSYVIACVTKRVCVLPADSTVNRSTAAKSRRPVRGRKIVITTGHLSRNDASSRPSTLPPRGRQASRSGRGCGSRGQAVSVPATTGNVQLDDDEWEADDAEKIPRESPGERRDRPRATVPRHAMHHDIVEEQTSTGSLLCAVL